MNRESIGAAMQSDYLKRAPYFTMALTITFFFLYFTLLSLYVCQCSPIKQIYTHKVGKKCLQINNKNRSISYSDKHEYYIDLCKYKMRFVAFSIRDEHTHPKNEIERVTKLKAVNTKSYGCFPRGKFERDSCIATNRNCISSFSK